MRRRKTYTEDQYRFKDLFRQLEIESLVYSVVMLQRKTEDRPPFTIRRQFGPRTGASEIDWALEWESLVASPKGAERILQSRPKPNPETELRVLHRLGDSGWETAEHMLVTSYPFSMEARTDPWAPHLMAACDGTRNARELFAELKKEGVLPEAAPDEEFARAIAILASGGFLSGAIMIRLGDRHQFTVAHKFLKSAYPDDLGNVLADRVGDFDHSGKAFRRATSDSHVFSWPGDRGGRMGIRWPLRMYAPCLRIWV